MIEPQETDADAPSGGVRVHASLPTSERRSRFATLLSFVLHLLLILLAIRLTANAVLPDHSPIGDAIQMVLGGGGGGGGQAGQAFALPAVALPPTATPPLVVPPPPTVIPPPPTTIPPAAPPPATADPNSASTVAAAGTGTGTGGGNGSGSGAGNGSGEGPGSGSGKGGGTGLGNGGVLAESKGLILPPLDGVPKELRGKPVDVTFYVAATGTVTDLSVAPPITNRDFAKKFDAIMRGYTFRPARDAAGNKIASVLLMTVTFGTK